MQLPDLPRFYHPELIQGQHPRLDEEECRHAKVLRLNIGSEVHLTDGHGRLFQGSITLLKKHLEVEVQSLLHEEEAPVRTLTLAVAPTKNMNRLEWVVEKAVEVGVHAIIPIQCEHSERLHLKQERLQRIALSAMKQSKTLWLPRIHKLSPFTALLDSSIPTRWIAHCVETENRSHIRCLAEGNGDQLVCIGPEGDFSEAEIEQAVRAGFTGVSLGTHRLRTETAAITACIAANLFHA